MNVMKYQKGLTLFELLTALIIASILALFAMNLYKGAEVDCRNPEQRPGYIARAYEADAIADLGALHLALHRYALNTNRWPESLNELSGRYGISDENLRDRWGNPYIYTTVWDTSSMGPVRKYKDLHPINKYFDLYSAGPDGKTATPMTSTPGCDDIVLAADGNYIGYAYRYYTKVGY